MRAGGRWLVIVTALALTAVALPSAGVGRTEATERPRFRLPAGTTVHVVGTNIVCQIHPTQPFISCFRVVKRGSRLLEAPGGYGFVVKADGDLLVNRLRGRSWTFEFGRVSTPVARIVRPGRTRTATRPIFHMRPTDQFWVPGSRIVCHVALGRRQRIPAIQCGFVDALARVGAPSSYGVGLSSSGTAYVVRFDGARRAAEVFNSRGTGAEGTVKVGTSTNVLVRLAGGRAITCGAIVSNGLKVMSCGTEQSGTTPPVAGDYDIVAVEDGTIAVRHRGRFVYAHEGSGLRASGYDEQPTPGPSIAVEPGQSFKLAGTRIVCQVATVTGIPVTHCGVADRFGLGVPGSQTVALRGDDVVAVLRWDRARRGIPVFRTP